MTASSATNSKLNLVDGLHFEPAGTIDGGPRNLVESLEFLGTPHNINRYVFFVPMNSHLGDGFSLENQSVN